MTHADDDGMIMPPKLSPNHVVIIPHLEMNCIVTKLIVIVMK